jgi:hypothetical protein
LSQDLTRVYQWLRKDLFYLAELEGGKLKVKFELDEELFGGQPKGKRELATAGKNLVS